LDEYTFRDDKNLNKCDVTRRRRHENGRKGDVISKL
jgi:hypothetical protein